MQNKELKKNSTKLLECPFCGGDADLEKGIGIFEHSVVCQKCRCRTRIHALEEDAIKKWNTRKPMDRIVEQIEGMFGVDPMYYGEEVKWAVDKAIEIVKEGGK